MSYIFGNVFIHWFCTVTIRFVRSTLLFSHVISQGFSLFFSHVLTYIFLLFLRFCNFLEWFYVVFVLCFLHLFTFFSITCFPWFFRFKTLFLFLYMHQYNHVFICFWKTRNFVLTQILLRFFTTFFAIFSDGFYCVFVRCFLHFFHGVFRWFVRIATLFVHFLTLFFNKSFTIRKVFIFCAIYSLGFLHFFACFQTQCHIFYFVIDTVFLQCFLCI